MTMELILQITVGTTIEKVIIKTSTKAAKTNMAESLKVPSACAAAPPPQAEIPL